MPNIEPLSQKRPGCGLPLSQATIRADIQWLAVAWAVRNRAQLAASESSLAAIGASQICGFEGELPGNLPEPDPTHGATHFHRHDEQPQWAGRHVPVALIGDFLFYNLALRR